MDMSRELTAAIDATKAAQKIVIKYFRSDYEVFKKADKSLVTTADKEAEDTIISLLKERFPAHSFHGEETGLTKGDAEKTWLIDPIDGTLNFVRGIPYFGISVCLVEREETLVAAVMNPITDELFYAEKGKGAYLNGKQIHVSDVNEIGSAVIGFSTTARKLAEKKISEVFHRMTNSVLAIASFGSISLALGDVACGRTDGRLTIHPHPDDCIAGTLLITEAGGDVQLLDGSKLSYVNLGDYIATNGKIHDELMKVVKGGN